MKTANTIIFFLVLIFMCLPIKAYPGTWPDLTFEVDQGQRIDKKNNDSPTPLYFYIRGYHNGTYQGDIGTESEIKEILIIIQQGFSGYSNLPPYPQIIFKLTPISLNDLKKIDHLDEDTKIAIIFKANKDYVFDMNINNYSYGEDIGYYDKYIIQPKFFLCKTMKYSVENEISVTFDKMK